MKNVSIIVRKPYLNIFYNKYTYVHVQNVFLACMKCYKGPFINFLKTVLAIFWPPYTHVRIHIFIGSPPPSYVSFFLDLLRTTFFGVEISRLKMFSILEINTIYKWPDGEKIWPDSKLAFYSTIDKLRLCHCLTHPYLINKVK